MEASGELDGGILDCSVGTIVWVRRRNGSWWPGRILGPHELSASHLMSPRSGTPVKLLGREDASVDWYNLEKSKRVKAFRCGEFDACIERAEASHGVPIKKREKYARREDAILHALELEKQQIEKRQRKLGSNFNYLGNNSSVMKKKLSSCSPSRVHSRNVVSIGNDQFVTPKLEQLSSRVDLPLQDASCGNSLFVQKGKNDKQHNGENVKSEVIPRMRGLQDFGLRIAPSKKKLTASVSYENSREAVSVDNHERVLPGSGHGMGGLNYTGNGKSYSSFKRRRSEGVPVESLVKRRDRRRPLVQVLQSSAKLPLSHSLMSNSDTVSVTVQEEKEHVGAICRSKRSRCVYVPADSRDHLDPNGYSSDHMQISPINSGYGNSLLYPGSVAEENTSSGVIEGDESDLSERDCLDPDTEEEEILHPAGTQILESRTSGEYVGNGIPSFMVQESFGNTKNGEEPLSGYISHLHPRDQNAGTSADGGVSKWHMKGKRNIRSLSKKSMGVMDGKFSDLSADKFDGPINVTEYESKRSTFKMGRERASRKVFCHRSEDYVYDEDDFVEKDLDSPPLAFDGCRYPLMLKAPLKVRGDYNIYSSDEDSPSHWEAEGLHHASQGVYQQADECYDPVYDGLEPMLLDVNLEVQATYQGERVPLVSLMSRLNGKAIIGHPIQIEILEDGSTDLFSRNDAREDPTAVEGSAAPPPVWRTGRRTAMQRVPRPHSTPSALDGGETDPHPYSNFEGKPPLNKAHTAHFNYQDKLMKNSHRSMSGKLQKKLLKKVSLSGLKTRTLSSFATEQKHSGENDCSRHTRKNSSMLNGLIKPDDTMPSVTCVPVKVVFSRILETVGRPPSAAGTHQFLLTGSIDVNPS